MKTAVEAKSQLYGINRMQCFTKIKGNGGINKKLSFSDRVYSNFISKVKSKR